MISENKTKWYFCELSPFPHSFCVENIQGLKTNKESWGHRSEKGCGKWHALIWCETRSWGVGRHTPNKNYNDDPSPPPSTLPLTKVRWHVKIHLYFGCQMTHLARAYPSFSSEQWIGILLVPSFLPPICHWMGCLSITRLTLYISEDLSVFQNWLILLNG